MRISDALCAICRRNGGRGCAAGRTSVIKSAGRTARGRLFTCLRGLLGPDGFWRAAATGEREVGLRLGC